MANYPAWWDRTITLYNKYVDPQTQVITWHRTTLDNCFWKNASDKVTIGTVVLETTKVICRIPANDNFLEYYRWVELPNDEMGDYFTLNQGDIIVAGEIEDTINEYQKGSRASDFIEKYKSLGCMEVKEISINTYTTANEPHYYVRGL